jgi:uncharacterized protein
MDKLISRLAGELNLTTQQISRVLELIEAGSTIPFIARYRKELTGSLDEVVLANIRDRHEQLKELEARKEAILKSIEKQEKLTPALATAIEAAETMAELEDIYLPYKPKRKTRASIAREKGLEPLAQVLFRQEAGDINKKAAEFVSSEKGVGTPDEALEGARDIMAEWVSEDAGARKSLRDLFWKEGVMESRVVKSKAETEDGQKFKDYFDWKEPIRKTPSHRLLALLRGEKEGILLLDLAPEEDVAVAKLNQQFVKTSSPAAEQVKLAVKDSYKRLIIPGREVRKMIRIIF